MYSEPIDRGLNAAILHITSRLFPSGIDVADNAPSTHAKLIEHLEAGSRMVVWTGASNATIYGCREVNYAFRAWHDWCHWRGGHDLSIEGELAACHMQEHHLLELYGDTEQTRKWRTLLRAEIVGHAEYYRRHKRFQTTSTSS